MIEAARSYSPYMVDEPNTWKPVKLPDGTTATYVCPNGHVGLIDEHEISDDGTVNPSVVCTQDDCNFHDYIKLLGWKPNG